MKECKGISTKPLDVKDVSLEHTKNLIPGCLSWLIRLVITNEEKDYQALDASQSCKNVPSEWQVMSIAQDIIHCSNNSRIKLPKHISLALCVHHLTFSRLLVTLLNKMGHSSSYDEI